MSNIYAVTVCSSCKSPVITSETGTIEVRGYRNLETVLVKLKAGKSLDQIAEQFCNGCLGELPCGCGFEAPQTISRFV